MPQRRLLQRQIYMPRQGLFLRAAGPTRPIEVAAASTAFAPRARLTLLSKTRWHVTCPWFNASGRNGGPQRRMYVCLGNFQAATCFL